MDAARSKARSRGEPGGASSDDGDGGIHLSRLHLNVLAGETRIRRAFVALEASCHKQVLLDQLEPFNN